MVPRPGYSMANVLSWTLVAFSMTYASVLTMALEETSGTLSWRQVAFSWLFLAWPILFLLGLRLARRIVMVAAFAAYLGQAAWLGVLVGGIHATIGAPMFLVALVFGWVSARRGPDGGYGFSVRPRPA